MTVIGGNGHVAQAGAGSGEMPVNREWLIQRIVSVHVLEFFIRFVRSLSDEWNASTFQQRDDPIEFV